MAKKQTIKETALRVLKIEAEAVEALKHRVDGGFTEAVRLILESTGKVVVTGMGKSGLICQKIASTLASTGTAAFFLHPAEGAHGDLGVLMKNDVLIAVSNSGETEEIITMVPAVKRVGVKMIVMTGKVSSTLGGYADVILDVGVKEEACPLGLAPTASTTATLAMGDALAVALLTERGFREDDFATLHPSGSLGKKLLKVSDLMHTGDGIPRVSPGALMKDVVLEMTGKRLGITGVFEGDTLKGVITDGDLRRALETGENVFEMKAQDVMCEDPKVIEGGSLAEEALKLMEDYSITAVFIVGGGAGGEGGGGEGRTTEVSGEARGEVTGVVHLHDLIRAGVI